MKKGFIFGTAAVVLGLGAAYLFSKNRKKDPQQENEKRGDTNVETLSPIVKKDYIEDVLSLSDPLEDFTHRRALYVMARIQKIKGETELERQEQMEFIEYFQLLDESWEEVLEELNNIPAYDEEAGRRDLRLYILLGKSRDAFYADSLNGEKDEDEVDEVFDLINSLDNLIMKWGL